MVMISCRSQVPHGEYQHCLDFVEGEIGGKLGLAQESVDVAV